MLQILSTLNNAGKIGFINSAIIIVAIDIIAVSITAFPDINLILFSSFSCMIYLIT